jgi:hypothetical protein
VAARKSVPNAPPGQEPKRAGRPSKAEAAEKAARSAELPTYEIKKPTGAGRGRPKGATVARDADGNIIRYKCLCCGTEYKDQGNNFLGTNSTLFLHNNGYYPVCKTCLGHYWETAILPAMNNDEKAGLRFLSGLMDLPFTDELYDIAYKIAHKYDTKDRPPQWIVPTFVGHRNLKQLKKYGSTALDIARVNRVRDISQQAVQEMQASSDEDYEPGDIDGADVWFFGPGYTPDQYRYLREQYNDWCERYDCSTKAQEEIFKNIAIAQINLQNAQYAGDAKRATDAMNTLQNLMNSAKIQPKQKKDDALVEQNTFGTLIQRWEDHDPIPEPAPEWQDVDGIKRYVETWFLGHLQKMFKIETDNARQYEEEIAKYTVEPPRFEEADDGNEGVSAMLKQMRGISQQEEDHSREQGGEI